MLKEIVLALSVSYPTIVDTIQDTISYISPRANQTQARKIINQEKAKLRFQEEIDLWVYKSLPGGKKAFSTRKANGQYVIGVVEDEITRTLLRHELYHIAKGDVEHSQLDNKRQAHDSINSWLNNQNLDQETQDYITHFKNCIEPSADLYSWTGLDIKHCQEN
jgi:hypothetical protein